ncbi:MAG: hypothetical protein BWX54_02326 [Verrucomicrobia bacterium ADurb.Bin018]|nr:MAG: hypothetical protein BWX54_02326 [Verrucomicrobia bacterium ADurb.Bin018]
MVAPSGSRRPYQRCGSTEAHRPTEAPPSFGGTPGGAPCALVSTRSARAGTQPRFALAGRSRMRCNSNETTNAAASHPTRALCTGRLDLLRLRCSRSQESAAHTAGTRSRPTRPRAASPMCHPRASRTGPTSRRRLLHAGRTTIAEHAAGGNAGTRSATPAACPAAMRCRSRRLRVSRSRALGWSGYVRTA